MDKIIYSPFSCSLSDFFCLRAGGWRLPAGIFSSTETTNGTDKFFTLCSPSLFKLLQKNPDKLKMRSLPRYAICTQVVQLQIRGCT